MTIKDFLKSEKSVTNLEDTTSKACSESKDDERSGKLNSDYNRTADSENSQEVKQILCPHYDECNALADGTHFETYCLRNYRNCGIFKQHKNSFQKRINLPRRKI